MENTGQCPIVVAIGDGDVEPVLRYAIWEALTHGCDLRLAHVGRTGERDRAERLLSDSVELAGLLADPGIRITGSLLTGTPVAAVLAAGVDARLVVVRHRDALNLLRAITEDHGHRPVPAVACVPTTWAGEPDNRRPVLVGIDDPARSRSLIVRSLEIAHAHQTSLRVFHAWRLPRRCDSAIHARIGDQWNRDARSALEATVTKWLDEHGDASVPVEIVVQHGVAADLLVEAARDAQVLVLERNPAAAGRGARVGRTARTALHLCPGPVLLLPSGRMPSGVSAPEQGLQLDSQRHPWVHQRDTGVPDLVTLSPRTLS